MKTYIKYGDTEFDPNKFNYIKNRIMFVKPYGGLWATSNEYEYDWKQWCKDNEFFKHDLNLFFEFTLKPDSKILTIKKNNDLRYLPKQLFSHPDLSFQTFIYLDFEELAKTYDALEVLISNDYGFGDNLYTTLYGWDCDTLLVMNPDSIKLSNYNESEVP